MRAVSGERTERAEKAESCSIQVNSTHSAKTTRQNKARFGVHVDSDKVKSWLNFQVASWITY